MYKSKLSVLETEKAIVLIKNIFTKCLEEQLNLIRVSAPKFLKTETGIQDDLAGTCNSVKFNIKDCYETVELVHSLAKWKRIILGKYDIELGKGIWTDMDAIRKDEILDDIHSVYVDQYDWELHIKKEDRTLNFLKEIVIKIYDCMKETEILINKEFKQLLNKLPDKITFIHSEDLFNMCPLLSPKDREREITKLYGAVFLIGIGYPIKQHDLRAVDYDDWITKTDNNHRGLNGDILVWDNVREDVLELSSMGIRVDNLSLKEQIEMTNFKNIKRYHEMIFNNEIPLSIGGGIGQSRLAMFLLEKKHIGEVQVSEWTEEIKKKCLKNGINLL